MTDSNQKPESESPAPNVTRSPRRRRSLKWLLSAAPAIAFAGMFFAKHGSAWAEDGGCRGRFGMSDEKADAFLENRLDFIFEAVDAAKPRGDFPSAERRSAQEDR